MDASTERAHDDSDFGPSELGTLEYWNKVYSRELNNFDDFGDTGEIWFGEDCQERVVRWLEKSQDVQPSDPILDLGCGNGALLLELRDRGFTDLTGIDYSSDAITLARKVLEQKDITDIPLEVADLVAASTCEGCASSKLGRQYQVCTDKGTYDAISLLPGDALAARKAYKETVSRLLRPGGLLVLTSCNWTLEQLTHFFQPEFKVTGKIPAPTFQFGGKTGSTVTSVIFQLQ